MCLVPEYQPEPSLVLAKLLKDNLDITIEPKCLKMFIKLHWDKIIKLAHSIHEQD